MAKRQFSLACGLAAGACLCAGIAHAAETSSRKPLPPPHISFLSAAVLAPQGFGLSRRFSGDQVQFAATFNVFGTLYRLGSREHPAGFFNLPAELAAAASCAGSCRLGEARSLDKSAGGGLSFQPTAASPAAPGNRSVVGAPFLFGFDLSLEFQQSQKDFLTAPGAGAFTDARRYAFDTDSSELAPPMMGARDTLMDANKDFKYVPTLVFNMGWRF